MMFALRTGVRLAWVGPDLVALNLGDGQYYCLPDLADAVASTPGGGLEIGDPFVAEGLVEADLIEPGPPAGGADESPIRPVRDELPREAVRGLARGMGGMARAYASVVRHYYGRPLRALVEVAGRGRVSAPRDDPYALAERVGLYEQLSPWTPFQGECLFHAFMLLAFLRGAGFEATWVFGVRTWPFQAHCWLQAEDVVLGDSLDRVAPFMPILAV